MMDEIASSCCGSCEYYDWYYECCNCNQTVFNRKSACDRYTPQNPVENPLIVEKLIKIHAEQMKKSNFQKIVDSEINFKIESFWDNGFRVYLGDDINGYSTPHFVETWSEIEGCLIKMVIEKYPESTFVKQLEKERGITDV